MEEKLFFHECRAKGQVFKTSRDWCNYLDEHKQSIHEAVAEHFGFKFNIHDVCLNPHIKASYKMDDMHQFEVRTAQTQYGWLYGISFNVGNDGFGCPACYPSRYDNSAPFFETEKDALVDALGFIIRQLEGKPKGKFRNILIYEAKKQRMNIVHPQLELFT